MCTLSKVVTLALAVAGSACASPQKAPIKSGDFGPPISVTTAPSLGSPAFGNFVRSREPQLQFCYAETRATSPGLAGSATVAVTLDAEGRVLNAGIVRHSWAGGNGDAVEQCVLARVRAWRFPAGDPEDGEDAKRAHSFAVIFTR